VLSSLIVSTSPRKSAHGAFVHFSAQSMFWIVRVILQRENSFTESSVTELKMDSATRLTRIKHYRFDEQTVNPTFERKRQEHSVQRYMSLIGLPHMAHICHSRKVRRKRAKNAGLRV